jgi:DNA invertase Pin-like site-specific DNA recombinase
MRIALYARVSTSRQAQAQTIEQQLERLHAHLASQGEEVDERNIFRDAGYSGASLSRPGLDHLRDRAALAEFDQVVVTAPDRLARKYVRQVLLMEELHEHGCTVEFVERPMSQDPHDQLLLQIRGAVAEYERTLICDRMRRGRLTHLRAGQLLPWTRAPFGYQLDPEHPRDPACLQLDPAAAAVVQEMFACYLEPQATVHSIALRLTRVGILTPTGKPRWNVASVMWRACGASSRTRRTRGRRTATARALCLLPNASPRCCPSVPDSATGIVPVRSGSVYPFPHWSPSRPLTASRRSWRAISSAALAITPTSPTYSAPWSVVVAADWARRRGP